MKITRKATYYEREGWEKSDLENLDLTECNKKGI